ncbi:unnamed protein product [Microthlaspi erraticum]|uniref:Reverse transcriptase zinc-binding domain-containing protein n=1 Tax=Microthlaspi erraticum TaxID=1685480 RepID=A0A6D2HYY1_9BRAS|nr:unnamed protein product [Microthlaspi erraticum]
MSSNHRNGGNVEIGKSQWLSRKPARPVQSIIGPRPSDLLVTGGREWNTELLQQCFSDADIRLMLGIRPGGASSKNGYSGLYKLAWETDTNPKVHHFLWRCLSNNLSVAKSLKKRRVLRDDSCCRCRNEEEDVNHLLFQCTFSRLVWAISGIPAPPNGVMDNYVYSNLYRMLTIPDQFPQDADKGKLVFLGSYGESGKTGMSWS